MITGKLADAGSGMEEQFSVLGRPIMQQIIRSGFKFGRDGLSARADAQGHVLVRDLGVKLFTFDY